jgi:hypothetical protein
MRGCGLWLLAHIKGRPCGPTASRKKIRLASSSTDGPLFVAPFTLKGQPPGCPSPVREFMALNPKAPCHPAARGQAIFLKATEPRAARPEGFPPRGRAAS